MTIVITFIYEVALCNKGQQDSLYRNSPVNRGMREKNIFHIMQLGLDLMLQVFL